MTPHRIIPIQGAANFRDLGGYETADGKIVKWGLLYRSDDLSDIDDAGVEKIRELGIRTVVDFRDRTEVAYSPDNLPETVRNITKIPIEAGKLMGAFSDENLTRLKTMGMMISVYRALIHDFQPSYRMFQDTLSQAGNAPILFHCTAGKDRTGVGAALLLSGLGVPRQTVFDDYLLSRKLLLGKYVPGVDYDAVMEPLYSVSPEFLEAAFEVLDNDYGGPEQFLSERLFVDLARLRKIYTAAP